MSILFDDARLSARPPGRSTTGLWLSVVLHAIVVVVLIVVPIRASEKPSTPRKRSMMVFILPATDGEVAVGPSRGAAPSSPPAPPRPVRELARAEVPKPLPVTPIVAKPVEPPPPCTARARDRTAHRKASGPASC